MNVIDASRGVLVAHARVREALERGAKRDATPEDLGLALVALDNAVGTLRRALDARCAHADRCECGHPRSAHALDSGDDTDATIYCWCDECDGFRLAYAST